MSDKIEIQFKKEGTDFPEKIVINTKNQNEEKKSNFLTSNAWFFFLLKVLLVITIIILIGIFIDWYLGMLIGGLSSGSFLKFFFSKGGFNSNRNNFDSNFKNNDWKQVETKKLDDGSSLKDLPEGVKGKDVEAFIEIKTVFDDNNNNNINKKNDYKKKNESKTIDVKENRKEKYIF